MEAYGFADWDGNDRHFMGWAGTGVHFDPIIASNAAHWLRANAGAGPGPAGDAAVVPDRGPGEPPRRHVVPDRPARVRASGTPTRWRRSAASSSAPPGRTTTRSRSTARPTTRSSTSCPANFHDDLHTKPEAHRQWRWDQQHGLWGYIDPADTKAWLRHLDYYVELHRLADESLGTVLGALEDARGVGRHRRDLHLGPRRHVRVPRAAVQGPVRLRRDHAGAAVRAGPGRDDGRDRRPTPWPPTSTWPPPSAPWPVSTRRRRRCGGAHRSGRRPLARPGRSGRHRCATTCCSPRTRPRPGT